MNTTQPQTYESYVLSRTPEDFNKIRRNISVGGVHSPTIEDTRDLFRQVMEYPEPVTQTAKAFAYAFHHAVHALTVQEGLQYAPQVGQEEEFRSFKPQRTSRKRAS